MRLRLLAVVAILGMPLMALGQPLADRVPADALVYIGCQGTQSMPPAYAQSHLKAVVDASNLTAFFKTYLPALIDRVGRDKPQAAENLKTLVALATPMIEHPCAFYFAGVDLEGPPQPKIGLLCNAGPDAQALLEQLNVLLAKAQNVPFTIKSFHKGDLVGVTVGYANEAAGFAGEGGTAKPMAGDAGFQASLAQVQRDAVAVCYVNFEGIQALIDQVLAVSNNARAQEMWPKVRDALGLGGLKQAIATSAFDGADWATQAFIAAPAPRTGLLTLMDDKPVSDEMLRSIPKNATAMTVGHFDLNKLISELRIAAGKIVPEQGQQRFDQVMGIAQLAIGVNVQTDLFAPLGSEWACYFDDSIAGAGPLGCVLLNRLTNADLAQKGIGRLELAIDNAINGQLVQRNKNLRLTFDQMKLGDLTVHYCMLPLVAPCWAVKDGMLFAALYPQALEPAARQASAKGPSIIDNPQFAALRQRLGGADPTIIQFLDLPRTSESAYQVLLAITQLGMGASDMAGVKAPVMLLPPLPTLKANLGPAGMVGWTDAAGCHLKRISPFPGAELLCIFP